MVGTGGLYGPKRNQCCDILLLDSVKVCFGFGGGEGGELDYAENPRLPFSAISSKNRGSLFHYFLGLRIIQNLILLNV